MSGRHRRDFSPENLGWTLVRCKNHQIYRCPCGEHTLVLAQSPSDYRGRTNSERRAVNLCPEIRRRHR